MSKTLPEPRFGRMLRAGLVGIPLMRSRLLGGEKNLVNDVTDAILAAQRITELATRFVTGESSVL